MDEKLFADLIASCNEAIANEKGETKLESTIVEVPDDEIMFYSKYQQLSENAKQAMHVILDEMLHI